MNLSRHFTLQEFLASDYAARHGIDNTPTPEIEGALLNTAAGMERVRAVLQQPIHINSGYRCPKLNSAIGGKPSSQHTKGEACDFICPEFGTPFQVARAIAAKAHEVGFDQLIYEFGQWVHCSFVDEKPRSHVLTINSKGTFNGLVA
jgi:uncharacterized protein YcbK (DUF882 family)